MHPNADISLLLRRSGGVLVVVVPVMGSHCPSAISPLPASEITLSKQLVLIGLFAFWESHIARWQRGSEISSFRHGGRICPAVLAHQHHFAVLSQSKLRLH